MTAVVASPEKMGDRGGFGRRGDDYDDRRGGGGGFRSGGPRGGPYRDNDDRRSEDTGGRGGGFGGRDRDDRGRGGPGGYGRDGGGGGGFGGRAPRDDGERNGFSRGPPREDNGFSRPPRDDRRDRDGDRDPPSRGGGFARREDNGFSGPRRDDGGRGFERSGGANEGSRGGFGRDRDDDRRGGSGFRSERHDESGFRGGRGGGFAGRDRGEGGFESRGGGRDRDEDERGFRPRGGEERRGGSGFGGGGSRSFGDRDRDRGRDDEPPSRGFGSRRGGDDDGGGGGFRRDRGRFGDDEDRRGGGGGGFRRDREDNGFNGGGRSGGFGDRGGDRGGETGGFQRRFADETVPEEAPRGWVPADRDVKDLFAEDTLNTLEEQVKDREVSVTGTADDQARIDSWENSPFSERMIHMLITQCHYPKPRNIQAATMPQILMGQDVMGQAETGSGKTAAFALPIVHWIAEEKTKNSGSRGGRPYAIVIAPTRELCLQLYEQCKKFASCCNVTVAKAYGQYDMNKNIMDISNGCDIICACTGRLRHLMEKGEVKPDNVRFLVLDECDRILRDNFKADVDQICDMRGFPKKGDRQTLMFSATVDDGVQQMAAELLRPNHAFISLKGEAGANAKVIQQFVELSGVADKNNHLFKLLTEEKEKLGQVRKTLIFVKAKRRTDIVAMILGKQGIPALSINGDRPQNLRERAMEEFRQGKVNVLVGTDVCERGLDIRDLEHVIQYDVATNRDTYVHRIGRTGRVKRGYATAFISPDDREEAEFIPDLVKIVDGVQQEVPEWLRNAANNARPGLSERFGERRGGGGRDSSYGGGGGGFGSAARESSSSFSGGGFGSSSSTSNGLASQNNESNGTTGTGSGDDAW